MGSPASSACMFFLGGSSILDKAVSCLRPWREVITGPTSVGLTRSWEATFRSVVPRLHHACLPSCQHILPTRLPTSCSFLCALLHATLLNGPFFYNLTYMFVWSAVPDMQVPLLEKCNSNKNNSILSVNSKFYKKSSSVFLKRGSEEFGIAQFYHCGIWSSEFLFLFFISKGHELAACLSGARFKASSCHPDNFYFKKGFLYATYGYTSRLVCL